MKQFSFLVRVPESYNSAHAKLAHPQWEQIINEWKSNGVYVLSFAFPGESFTVSGEAKTIRKEVVLSGNLKAVSHLILQAATMEDALALAKSCPVLLYGGMIEIREVQNPVILTRD